MGSPDDAKFNVSPVLIEKDMMVLNLAVSIRHIFKWYEKLDESRAKEDTDKELITWLTLLILTVATFYAVKEENREFKSEYIIPQMPYIETAFSGFDEFLFTGDLRKIEM